jgi:hypothetical protein
MITNYVIDFLVGLTPIIGDVLDFAWQANRMNINLILKHLQEAGRKAAAEARATVEQEMVMEGKYTVKG